MPDAARMDPETVRGYGLPKVCPAAPFLTCRPARRAHDADTLTSCLRLLKPSRLLTMQLSTDYRLKALQRPKRRCG